jgi:hypothetical protein
MEDTYWYYTFGAPWFHFDKWGILVTSKPYFPMDDAIKKLACDINRDGRLFGGLIKTAIQINQEDYFKLESIKLDMR